MLKIINKSTKINKLDFKKLNRILKDKDINIEDCEKMKSILLQDFKLVSFENVNEDYVTITFNKGYFYKYSDKLNVSKGHYSNSKTFVLGSFKYDADGYYVEIVPGYLIYNHTSYITDKYKHKTNVDTLKEQINNELVNLELQNKFSTTLSPTNIGINGSFVFPEKLFCPETKIDSLKFKIMSPIREGVQSEMIKSDSVLNSKFNLNTSSFTSIDGNSYHYYDDFEGTPLDISFLKLMINKKSDVSSFFFEKDKSLKDVVLNKEKEKTFSVKFTYNELKTVNKTNVIYISENKSDTFNNVPVKESDDDDGNFMDNI